MKTQSAADRVTYRELVHGYVQPALENEMCVFFLNGSCNRGDTCHFSHSSRAPRPICKFFLTLQVQMSTFRNKKSCYNFRTLKRLCGIFYPLFYFWHVVYFDQGCRNGNSCSFSHDSGSLVSSSITSGICSQENRATSVCCKRLLPAAGDGHILVMNDKSLQFACKLCNYYDPTKIIACTPGPHSFESDSVTKGLKILQNLADPSYLFIGGEHKLSVPWTKLSRVFWFADIDSNESISEQVVLQKFFQHIAIKTLSEKMSDLQVIVIMNNAKFVQLQVNSQVLLQIQIPFTHTIQLKTTSYLMCNTCFKLDCFFWLVYISLFNIWEWKRPNCCCRFQVWINCKFPDVILFLLVSLGRKIGKRVLLISGWIIYVWWSNSWMVLGYP